MNFKNTLKSANRKPFWQKFLILILIIVGLHIILGRFSKKCTIENLDLPISKKEEQSKQINKLLSDINMSKLKQQNLSKKLA